MAYKKKICIVTALHPSLNPRVVKEADTLSANGYEVSVIAPDFSKWAHEADAAFHGRPWRIVAAPKFGPLAPPLTRSRELIRRSLAGVLVNTFHRTETCLVNSVVHPVTPDLIQAAKKSEADLYIGHYIAGLPAAAIAARTNNSIYAFDAEDFHLGDPPYGSQYDKYRRNIRLTEERYLPDATYITAAAPGIADAYSDTYGIKRPTVILNVFSKENVPEQPRQYDFCSRHPSIYWFSQTIGPNRGLECAVRAIALSKTKPLLSLRGFPSEPYVTSLRNLAKMLGVADRLVILEPAHPSLMEQLAAEHDIGYVGETGHSFNRRIMLTNKQFIYMLAGLPSIMSDIPSHCAFAKEAPGAVQLFKTEDPESLAEVFDLILSDESRFSAARKSAWLLGRERFNWENEQYKLLRIVNGVFHDQFSKVSEPS